jgi:hypothetical protein
MCVCVRSFDGRLQCVHSNSILREQAELMRRLGVDEQVFCSSECIYMSRILKPWLSDVNGILKEL